MYMKWGKRHKRTSTNNGDGDVNILVLSTRRSCTHGTCWLLADHKVLQMLIICLILHAAGHQEPVKGPPVFDHTSIMNPTCTLCADHLHVLCCSGDHQELLPFILHVDHSDFCWQVPQGSPATSRTWAHPLTHCLHPFAAKLKWLGQKTYLQQGAQSGPPAEAPDPTIIYLRIGPCTTI